MTLTLIASLALTLALSTAPQDEPAAAGQAADPVISLDQLPIEQAAAARCGMVFALVSRWQKTGDPRGESHDNMETGGGREFFVRTMANLMDAAGITNQQVAALAMEEVNKLDTPEGGERAEAMMPACLLMKEAAGL